jgi:signal transduction histidine kinase
VTKPASGIHVPRANAEEESEKRPEGQTNELAELKKALQTEIKKRRRAEKALRHRQSTLQHSHEELRELTSQRDEAEESLRENHTLLQRKQKELGALAARLLTAQEEERKRIARELHDDLIQKLAVLAIRTEWLEKHLPASPELTRQQLRSLSGRVAELSAEVRRMAQQLHPSILEDLGLAVALRSYIDQFSKREGVRVEFTNRELPETLPPDISSCLYRVAQESLRNAAKHAHTKEVMVTLALSNSGLSLSVKDKGVGFDPDSVIGGGGLGLVSMRERVRLLNGSFSLSSYRGTGTEVLAWIPLPGGGV